MLILSGIILAFAILLPLCLRLRIDWLSGFLGSIILGSVTSIPVYLLKQKLTLNIFQILGIEVIIILGLALGLSIYKFYRDPERIPPNVKHIIVSPADGRITYIKEVKDGQFPLSTKSKKNKIQLTELTQTDLIRNACYLIGIQLSLIDVHVNRMPVSGKVVMQKHIPGKALSLREDRAPLQNERLTTIIDQGLFQIGVVQIASHLVRRIQSYIRSGQHVQIGERLGIIKFGSQVDVIIPWINDLRLQVKTGEKVIAGVTIVAKYNGESDG